MREVSFAERNERNIAQNTCGKTKQKKLCVLYIERPYQVTMNGFEIFAYMYGKIRPLHCFFQSGFTGWTE